MPAQIDGDGLVAAAQMRDLGVPIGVRASEPVHEHDRGAALARTTW